MNPILSLSELQLRVNHYAIGPGDIEKTPPELAQAYLEAALAFGTPKEICHAKWLLAEVTSQQGDFYRAIRMLEDLLREHPEEIEAHSLYFPIGIERIAIKFEEQAWERIDDFYFGPTYAELMVHGCVPMSVHIAAIHHFIGQKDGSRAIDACLRLRKAAPNAIGLSHALKLVFELTGDSRLLQSQGGES